MAVSRDRFHEVWRTPGGQTMPEVAGRALQHRSCGYVDPSGVGHQPGLVPTLLAAPRTPQPMTGVSEGASAAACAVYTPVVNRWPQVVTAGLNTQRNLAAPRDGSLALVRAGRKRGGRR